MLSADFKSLIGFFADLSGGQTGLSVSGSSIGLVFSGNPASSVFKHSRDIGLILTAASPVRTSEQRSVGFPYRLTSNGARRFSCDRLGRGFSCADYAADTPAFT